MDFEGVYDGSDENVYVDAAGNENPDNNVVDDAGEKSKKRNNGVGDAARCTKQASKSLLDVPNRHLKACSVYQTGI